MTGDQTGWTIARDQAAALTGPDGRSVTLATIDSAALDAFVFTGVDDAAYWTQDTGGGNEGPILGGYQTDKLAEPNGHWAWVDGTLWDYTQWSGGEPNNYNGNEDYLYLYGLGSARTGNWNDGGNGPNPIGTAGAPKYYIAEASGAAVVSGVPEPTSWALMILGFGAVGSTLRRRSVRMAVHLSL